MEPTPASCNVSKISTGLLMQPWKRYTDNCLPSLWDWHRRLILGHFYRAEGKPISRLLYWSPRYQPVKSKKFKTFPEIISRKYHWNSNPGSTCSNAEQECVACCCQRSLGWGRRMMMMMMMIMMMITLDCHTFFLFFSIIFWNRYTPRIELLTFGSV